MKVYHCAAGAVAVACGLGSGSAHAAFVLNEIRFQSALTLTSGSIIDADTTSFPTEPTNIGFGASGADTFFGFSAEGPDGSDYTQLISSVVLPDFDGDTSLDWTTLDGGNSAVLSTGGGGFASGEAAGQLLNTPAGTEALFFGRVFSRAANDTISGTVRFTVDSIGTFDLDANGSLQSIAGSTFALVTLTSVGADNGTYIDLFLSEDLPIPAPGVAGVLALAGVAASRRRR